MLTTMCIVSYIACVYFGTTHAVVMLPQDVCSLQSKPVTTALATASLRRLCLAGLMASVFWDPWLLHMLFRVGSSRQSSCRGSSNVGCAACIVKQHDMFGICYAAMQSLPLGRTCAAFLVSTFQVAAAKQQLALWT
jgi:hypothetical protein